MIMDGPEPGSAGVAPRRYASTPKAVPGDKVAILSPSFAAPGIAPDVHEQAMKRLSEVTGLEPVEYATTRRLGASARDRALDLNAAFGDPEIRAVLATVGGEDQITVVPHLNGEIVSADPKPFLGYSDNTNVLNWLWNEGVAGFYGGSTQVHLGPGPAVDEIHARSLRAALLTGEHLEITEPGESEDIGREWTDPAALTEYGEREPTEPWAWAGPHRAGDRPDLGWLRRGGAVGPHRRTLPPGFHGAAGWDPTAGDLRGTDSCQGVRLDPALPR